MGLRFRYRASKTSRYCDGNLLELYQLITLWLWQACFFDKNRLTDGPPPNDRGCRACGKIGHLVADCPRKKASDNRKRENRENRENRERLRSERSETGSERQEEPPGGGRVRTRSELSEQSGKTQQHFDLRSSPLHTSLS